MKLENLLRKNGFEKKGSTFQKGSFTGGGYTRIEAAETKLVAPEDFSYAEKRVHIDDLLSILSINKLMYGKSINERDAVLNFFKDHKVIETGLDGDYFYTRTKADPSHKGLEIAFTKVKEASSAMLEALCEGITPVSEAVKAIKARKLWANLTFELESLTDYKHLSFPLEEESPRTCENCIDNTEYDNLPESYRNIKIGMSPKNARRFFLAEEGVYVVNGKFRSIARADCIVNNNTRSKKFEELDLTFSAYKRDDKRGRFERESYIEVEIQKPTGIKIEYLKDLEKIKHVKIHERVKGSKDLEYDVNIKVGFNEISIESLDKKFYLKLDKPICEGCSKPQWKFGWSDPNDEIMEQVHKHWTDGSEVKDPFTWHIGMRSGGLPGIQEFFLHFENGNKRYCSKNCLEEAYSELIRDMPFAHQPKAEGKINKLLQNLQLGETNIAWYTAIRELSWEIFLEREFEQEGRKTGRYLGILEMDFKTGKITKKMYPKKVREFVYKK